MADDPTTADAGGSRPVSRSHGSSAPGNNEESAYEVPNESSRTESGTTIGDRMAVTGFVCSLCVVLFTVVLVPIANMPSSNEAAEGIFGFLLLAGAILWVSGLVLSLRPRTEHQNIGS